MNQQRNRQPTPAAGPGYLRIGQLAKRTGVSPELLRAWEQRYGLLQPTRTPGGFRLYSTDDEARVQRMQRLVSGGLAAAQAARLVLSGGEPAPPTASPAATTLEAAAATLTTALDRLDEQAANTALDRLFSTYTVETVLGAKAKAQAPSWPACPANTTNSACWPSGSPCAAGAGGSPTSAPTAPSAPSPTSPDPSDPRSWSC